MANVKTAAAINVDAKIRKIANAFADRRKKLIGLRDAKKLTQAQYEELLSVINNRESRAKYQVVRNTRPDVLAKRKTYNQKRYNDQKAAMKRAKELGIL